MADRYYAKDLAYSTLVADINASVTTLTVTSAASFPTSVQVPFLVMIGTEIIKVGALNTSTGVMSTLTRGHDGSTAASHTAGDTVACRVIADYVNNAYDYVVQEVAGKAATIHNLVDTTNHPVTGLTTGHLLKATGATTYAFSASTDLPLAGGTMSGPITMADQAILQPDIKDYVETLAAATWNTATHSIDLEDGNVHKVAITAAVTTLTFTNPRAGAHSFTLILTQDGTGRAITWPASVKWPNGTAPIINGASEVHILTFMTPDSGTTWYGFLAGSDMS